MMSILGTIKKAEEQSRSASRPYADFYNWLDGLSKEDKAALDDALRAGRVAVKTLHKALREDEGVSFGEAGLYDYRKQLLKKFLG